MSATSDNVDVRLEDIHCLLEGLISTVKHSDGWQEWNLCQHREWTDDYVSACLKLLLKATEKVLLECDICEKVVVSEDDLEECSCKRKVCEKCSNYEREYDTGAEVFDRCATCQESLFEAEESSAVFAETSPYLSQPDEDFN